MNRLYQGENMGLAFRFSPGVTTDKIKGDVNDCVPLKSDEKSDVWPNVL